MEGWDSGLRLAGRRPSARVTVAWCGSTTSCSGPRAGAAQVALVMLLRLPLEGEGRTPSTRRSAIPARSGASRPATQDGQAPRDHRRHRAGLRHRHRRLGRGRRPPPGCWPRRGSTWSWSRPAAFSEQAATAPSWPARPGCISGSRRRHRTRASGLWPAPASAAAPSSTTPGVPAARARAEDWKGRFGVAAGRASTSTPASTPSGSGRVNAENRAPSRATVALPGGLAARLNSQ